MIGYRRSGSRSDLCPKLVEKISKDREEEGLRDMRLEGKMGRLENKIEGQEQDEALVVRKKEKRRREKK